MIVVHDPSLTTKLSSSHIILDTNVFFHAADNAEFYDFLVDLHEKGCAFLTIQSVVFEFARGAKNIDEFNWYVDFVNNLGVSIYKDVENIAIKDKAFAVLLQKYIRSGKKGTSYTDFLLLMVLHKFQHLEDSVFLMTANYTDVPIEVFDRDTAIALEYKDSLQTQALYKNSGNKLAALTQ